MRSLTTLIPQLLITLIILVPSLYGQEEKESLLSDTIVVVKDLQINVEQRAPYHLQSEVQETSTNTQKQIEVSNLEEIDITYQDPPLSIKPIRYTDRLEKQGNDGFIKVGYGTPRAIDSKVLYTYHIEDWYQIGIKAGYSSANNESRDNMEYTNWHTGISGGYWLRPNFKLSIDSDFKRLNQGLYGLTFGEKPILPNQIIQSVENRLGFNLTKYESLGLQLDGIIAFDAAEIVNAIPQQNELYGEIHLAKKIGDQFAIDITSEGKLLTLADDQEAQKSYSINPALRYYKEDLAIEAGVHYLQYDNSAIFWPRLKANYKLPELPLIVELSSQLTSKMVSLHSITQINPFLQIEKPSGALTEFSGLTREREVQLSGQYTLNKFNITPYYQFLIQNERPIFNRNSILFSVELEDEIQSHTAGLQADYTVDKRLSFEFEGYYNFYKTEQINSLSYLPLYKLELTANQKFVSERLLLMQSIHLSERTVGGSPINPVTLQAFDGKILNLNASINFKIFPNFWIYAEGDNLLIQDYEIWQDYAVFQPRAIFGIKYLVGQN